MSVPTGTGTPIISEKISSSTKLLIFTTSLNKNNPQQTTIFKTTSSYKNNPQQTTIFKTTSSDKNNKKTPTSTTSSIKTNSDIPNYKKLFSGFLLLKSKNLSLFNSENIKTWLDSKTKNKDNEVTILSKKLLQEQNSKRKRSLEENISVQMLIKTQNNLTNLKKKPEDSISNVPIEKFKFWILGETNCLESLKCENKTCQVNDTGDFYCLDCSNYNKNISTKEIYKYYCLREQEQEKKNKKLLALLVLLLIPLILILFCLFYICKKKRRSREHIEINKISPANPIDHQIQNTTNQQNITEEYDNVFNKKINNNDFSNHGYKNGSDFITESNTFRFSSDDTKGSVRGLY